MRQLLRHAPQLPVRVILDAAVGVGAIVAFVVGGYMNPPLRRRISAHFIAFRRISPRYRADDAIRRALHDAHADHAMYHMA